MPKKSSMRYSLCVHCNHVSNHFSVDLYAEMPPLSFFLPEKVCKIELVQHLYSVCGIWLRSALNAFPEINHHFSFLSLSLRHCILYLQQLSVGDIVYCTVSSYRNIAGVVVRVLATHPPNVRVFHDLNAKVCQNKNVHFPSLLQKYHLSLSVCQSVPNHSNIHELCIFFVGFSAWFGSKTNYRSCGQHTFAAMQWHSVLWNYRIIWNWRSYGGRHERPILSTKICQP